MIGDDQELSSTLDRIDRFQRQVAHLRNMEPNPENYHAAASSYLAEIGRMQLRVREYLSLHPKEMTTGI
jgi:dihydroxyacid dehydratase/phosphogluconate dehydratase